MRSPQAQLIGRAGSKRRCSDGLDRSRLDRTGSIGQLDPATGWRGTASTEDAATDAAEAIRTAGVGILQVDDDGHDAQADQDRCCPRPGRRLCPRS